MTDTRRYILVWFAAALIGVNAGAGALVLTMLAVDAWLRWLGAPRTVVLWGVFIIVSLAATYIIGKALVRTVSKQLNPEP